MSMIELNNQTSKVQRGIEQKQEIIDLKMTLSEVMTRPDLCSCHLNSQAPDNPNPANATNLSLIPSLQTVRKE